MIFIGIIYSIKVFTRDLSWKIPLKYLKDTFTSKLKDNLKFSMFLVKEPKFMIYKKVYNQSTIERIIPIW